MDQEPGSQRGRAASGSRGGYICNLGTCGRSTGTWTLRFTASGDPVAHSVCFDVRWAFRGALGVPSGVDT